MRTRAIRRRAYVRYLETEIINEIKKSDNSCLEFSVNLDDEEEDSFAHSVTEEEIQHINNKAAEQALAII